VGRGGAGRGEALESGKRVRAAGARAGRGAAGGSRSSRACRPSFARRLTAHAFGQGAFGPSPLRLRACSLFAFFLLPFSPLQPSSLPPLTSSLLPPAASFIFSPGQSVLDPAGAQAARIGGLWWLMFWTLLGVYVVVVAVTLAAAFRRRRRAVDEVVGGVADEVVKGVAAGAAGARAVAAEAPDTKPDAGSERRLSLAVKGAVGLTVAILLVLMVASFWTGRAVFSGVAEPEELTIRVTGHQWWWEVEYEGPVPSESLTTANEIHIPVGRRVLFKLTSADVIHSFWVPNLHGKTDLIPGHTRVTWLRADRAGRYRGQCAEFCGYQHAHMAFVVVAEPEEEFRRWYAAQLRPAPPPSTPEQARGLAVFLSSPCVTCHRIQGTDANGTVGPDLTHVAGRESLAAATIQNTRGHLAGWVTDPQKIKPGALMPQNNLDPEELRALLDYLESLK